MTTLHFILGLISVVKADIIKAFYNRNAKYFLAFEKEGKLEFYSECFHHLRNSSRSIKLMRYKSRVYKDDLVEQDNFVISLQQKHLLLSVVRERWRDGI